MTDSLRVLIVDDNEDHARLAAEFLMASGSFAIEVAQDLQELWDYLAAQEFDVVLLDYNLPDGNGLEALAEFPERGHRVPVVMVTGRGDERVAAQAIQRGAIDYLVKAGDYLLTLPALVEKAARAYQLKLLAQHSLEQIRYQALLLDNVHDAVVVWDLEGRITFWNYAAERLFGWRADERIGQLAERCYLNWCNPPIALPGPDGTGVGDVERQGVNRAGQTLWLSSNATRLFDSSGQLRGYMDVSRDVTGRKKMEAQIQAAQAQLTQAARL
ncbi:MAG: response regulator, partial [Anaerolineales bacterium]